MSAKQKQECMIIVHGLHQDGRPRAAAYGMSSEELAIKAAEKWKLRIGYAVDDAGRALAKDVPSGLQHPFNKVDAPVVRQDIYIMLVKVLVSEPPGSTQLPAAHPQADDVWQNIKVGDVVLHAADETEGFFKCEVKSVSKDGHHITLAWLGWPKLSPVKVKRSAVGILRKGK